MSGYYGNSHNSNTTPGRYDSRSSYSDRKSSSQSYYRDKSYSRDRESDRKPDRKIYERKSDEKELKKEDKKPEKKPLVYSKTTTSTSTPAKQKEPEKPKPKEEKKEDKKKEEKPKEDPKPQTQTKAKVTSTPTSKPTETKKPTPKPKEPEIELKWTHNSTTNPILQHCHDNFLNANDPDPDATIKKLPLLEKTRRNKIKDASKALCDVIFEFHPNKDPEKVIEDGYFAMSGCISAYSSKFRRYILENRYIRANRSDGDEESHYTIIRIGALGVSLIF